MNTLLLAAPTHVAPVLALPWPRAFWTPGVPDYVYETYYARGRGGYVEDVAFEDEDFLGVPTANILHHGINHLHENEVPDWPNEVEKNPYTRTIPEGQTGRADVEQAKLEIMVYDGPSIRKRILAMLNGDEEEFHVHVPVTRHVTEYGASNRITLFFNKKKIAMYNSCYLTHITRYGNGAMRKHGTYWDNKHSSVTQVYFTGKHDRVTVLKRKMNAHMDLSYKLEMAHLHNLVHKYARIYLKHYGYKATTLQDAITPIVNNTHQYPETEKYKIAWRQPSIKGVLHAAGLPTGKAVVRALGSVMSFSVVGRRLPHGEHYRHPLVNLTLLRLLWCICGDPTVLRDAIYKRCSMTFPVWQSPKGYIFHRAIKSLVKPFTKREKIALARSIIDITENKYTRSPYNDIYDCRTNNTTTVADFLTMAKDKYTEAPDTVVETRTVRALHDEMSTHVEVAVLRKAEDIDIDAAIEYPEAVAAINDTMLPDGYQVVLPETGIDLVSLGKCLHNCIGSYARRVINQETAVAALYKEGKLFGAFEVQGGKMRQVSAYCNYKVTPALRIHLEKLVGEMDYYETGNAVQGVFQQAQVPHAQVAAPVVIPPPAAVMENQGAMFVAAEPHQPNNMLDDYPPTAYARPRVELDDNVPF